MIATTYVLVHLLVCLLASLLCLASDNALILHPHHIEHLDTPQLSSKYRSLYFSGHPVIIEQRWQEVGVAAVVWDAAIILCDYLATHKELVLGKTVVELGAGTGVVGIVAAQLGGYVTLTDRKFALKSLLENVDKNREILCVPTACDVCNERDFFRQNTETLANKCHGLKASKVTELDWGHNLSAFPSYEVVLGADIVYMEDTFEDLLLTMKALTSRNNILLLSCKIRYERDRRFLKLMRKDFDLTLLVSDVPKDIYLYRAILKH